MVSENVDGEDHSHQGRARGDDHMRGDQHIPCAVTDHAAPGCAGRLHAQSQKRQSRLTNDHARHSEAGFDNQGSADEREHVTGDDPCRGSAGRHGGMHVVAFLHGEDLRPGQPGIAHPTHGRQGDDDVVDARPHHAGQRNGQQDSREGEKDVHDANENQVKPPSRIRANGAEQAPDDQRNADHGKGHEKRRSSAYQQAIEHRPAQVVVAQPLVQATGCEDVRQVYGVRRQGQHGREKRDQCPEQDHAER